MKFETKPAIVLAIQFFPDTVFPTEFALDDYRVDADRSLWVMTPHGERKCDFGDWIVRHPKNGFSVVKRADFDDQFSRLPSIQTR